MCGDFDSYLLSVSYFASAPNTQQYANSEDFLSFYRAEGISPSYRVKVAEELLYAAILDNLHPDYVNATADFPLLPHLSRYTFAKGHASHADLRQHLRLLDQRNLYTHMTLPQLSSGFRADALAAFLRGALAAGPVDGRPRGVVVANRGLVHVLSYECFDGQAISPDVGWDLYGGGLVGFASATLDDLRKLFTDNAGQPTSSVQPSLVRNFVLNNDVNSEATVTMIISADGTISAPVAVFYHKNGGGEARVRNHHKTLHENYERCLRCLELKIPCDNGKERCSQCRTNDEICVKARLLVLSSDRASGISVQQHSGCLSCYSFLFRPEQIVFLLRPT